MKYFEFSHLFTQWGAKHAPKVMAMVDGQLKQLFGWDTDSKDPEYTGFLTLFLQELLAFVKENDLEQRVYFHLSDEPNLADMDTYRAASELIRPILEGFPIIDALSEYEFYESGLIKHPIPASNGIRPFLDHGVEGYGLIIAVPNTSSYLIAFFICRHHVIGYSGCKFIS